MKTVFIAIILGLMIETMSFTSDYVEHHFDFQGIKVIFSEQKEGTQYVTLEEVGFIDLLTISKNEHFQNTLYQAYKEINGTDEILFRIFTEDSCGISMLISRDLVKVHNEILKCRSFSPIIIKNTGILNLTEDFFNSNSLFKGMNYHKDSFGFIHLKTLTPIKNRILNKNYNETIEILITPINDGVVVLIDAQYTTGLNLNTQEDVRDIKFYAPSDYRDFLYKVQVELTNGTK